MGRKWAKPSPVAVGGRSLGVVRCNFPVLTARQLVVWAHSTPLACHPALPSVHDAYCFFRCSRRGVVSPEVVVQISVTLEPWSCPLFRWRSSIVQICPRMFNLYAFDWSPRLLSIRASESPAVQKNLLEKTRRPRLEELQWIHSVL